MSARTSEILDSTARISVIETFVPLTVDWYSSEPQLTARLIPDAGSFLSHTGGSERTIFFKSMPMLISSEGVPWDLGNLYLINLLYKRARVGEANINTIRSHADCLLHYLRWIEDAQKNNKDIHVLYFPKNESLRVSYRYRRYLLGLVKKNIISPGTASKRMSRVIAFYRSCIEDNLVGLEDIPNLPFEDVQFNIMTTNRVGLYSFAKVKLSNLAIKRPKSNSRVDEVKDQGEKLRPLREAEQNLILSELRENSMRIHQLIFLFSLFTGARIQTVGTLRIHPFLKAFQAQCHLKEIRLTVGQGTEIDTKKSRRYVLHVPTILAEEIVKYVRSSAAEKCRLKSFYGDSDENYVFLTKSGAPYYTSKKEIDDRQLISDPWSNETQFTIKTGEAIREKVKSMVHSIRQKEPSFRSFRFHDLRATFANNYLSDYMANPVVKKLPNGSLVDITRRVALGEVCQRMGHESESTTELYLDYIDNIDEERKVTEIFEKRLFKWM